MSLIYQPEQSREQSGIQVARYVALHEAEAEEFGDLQTSLLELYEDDGVDIVLETYPQVNLSRYPIPMSWLRDALQVRSISSAVKELQHRYSELGSTALSALHDMRASRPYRIFSEFEGARCVEMGWQFNDPALRIEQAQLAAMLPGVPTERYGLNQSAHMPILSVPVEASRRTNALGWDFLAYAVGRVSIDLEPYFNVTSGQETA